VCGGWGSFNLETAATFYPAFSSFIAVLF